MRIQTYKPDIWYMENTKQFLMNIDESLHREFKLACVKNAQTMAEVVRQMMAEYIKSAK